MTTIGDVAMLQVHFQKAEIADLNGERSFQLEGMLASFLHRHISARSANDHENPARVAIAPADWMRA
jgi:hypothetical protein